MDKELLARLLVEDVPVEELLALIGKHEPASERPKLIETLFELVEINRLNRSTH